MSQLFVFHEKSAKMEFQILPLLRNDHFVFLSKKCDFLLLLIGFDSFKKVPPTSAPIIKSGGRECKKGAWWGAWGGGTYHMLKMCRHTL